jgi:hypothetical protein
MSRIWQDAMEILETASAHRESHQSDFAILVDDRNGLRMVDGTGWQVEALRTEYQATAAFLVKRTPTSVVVQAQSGSDRCEFHRSIGVGALAGLTGGVAHHLIRRQPFFLKSGN